ncbi:MAG TPA: twin-arginine translocation signal domain-containing protein, partial [bacterium]|nr:twin-arginine translocation signal domain-containing protein [bacterium]
MPTSKSNGTESKLQTTRRGFLKGAGASAAVLGLSSAGIGPFVQRGALAADKELKILQWSHFVPAYDTWFDKFAKDWGTANGVNVVVDHVPHLELPARAAAEVAANAGHDLFGFNGAGLPFVYEKHTVDMTKLVAEIEKKFGKVSAAGRGVAFNTVTKSWPAYPDYYIRLPGLYRKDLWEE